MASLPRLPAPADLGRALALLPRIARDVHAMAVATRVLPQVAEDMAEVSRVVTQMDGRMAVIERAMPILVDVETSLAGLPRTVGSLELGMRRLNLGLDELLISLVSLDEGVRPLARLAQRIPSRSRPTVE